MKQGQDVMTEMACILGILFLLICVVFTILHSFRLYHLTLLDWSVLAMGGVYGGAWAIVAFVAKKGGTPFWDQWLLPFRDIYPLHTLSALILLGAIWFGWVLAGSFHIVRKRDPYVYKSRNVGKLSMAMWTLLSIAFVTQWLYTRAYGGFIGYLEYSRLIRSGIFIVDNPLSFLQPFGGLVLFASFGFLGLWLTGCRRSGQGLGFLLSFSFSLFMLYAWHGRIAFMVFLATFGLGIILLSKPRPSVMLAWGVTTMISIIVGAYFVSIWLNLKPADNFMSFMAKELAFPFGSFFAQYDSGAHLCRLFKDFIWTPVYLLPSSWWINWVENVGQINTAIIMGAPKGSQGVTGAIPIDLITLGFMQASIAGIVVVGLIFGALLRLIQRLIDRLYHPGVHAFFEAYIILKIAVLGLFYSHPPLFVRGNFNLLFTAVLIVFFLKLPRFKIVLKQKPALSI